MIWKSFCVISDNAQNRQNVSLQRSRDHLYLAGGENLKGFGPLVMENEYSEVEYPWFLTESYVC